MWQFIGSELLTRLKISLTLFWSGGYQIDTCLPFTLYLQHDFCSESKHFDWNMVISQFNFLSIQHHGMTCPYLHVHSLYKYNIVTVVTLVHMVSKERQSQLK